jgi:hypothetical protein
MVQVFVYAFEELHPLAIGVVWKPRHGKVMPAGGWAIKASSAERCPRQSRVDQHAFAARIVTTPAHLFAAL